MLKLYQRIFVTKVAQQMGRDDIQIFIHPRLGLSLQFYKNKNLLTLKPLPVNTKSVLKWTLVNYTGWLNNFNKKTP